MSAGTRTPKFEAIYVKYGDTLYQRYNVIYLIVVKDTDHDCKRDSHASNRQDIRGQVG